MEALQKENYLIIGCSASVALLFVAQYKEINKQIKFFGLTSKKITSNSLFYEKVYSYGDKSIEKVEFSRVLIFASRLPSDGGCLSDFLNVNNKILEALNHLTIMNNKKSRITFISSISIFQKNLEYINDSTIPNPQDYYGESKLLMESNLIKYSDNRDCSLIICRMPVFLYPNSPNPNFINKITKACRDKGRINLFNPKNKLSAVFDLKHLLLIENSKVNRVNILNCGAIPDISFEEIGVIAEKNGLKEVLWGFNDNYSTLVDITKIEGLIGTSPSAKEIVIRSFLNEFSSVNE